MRKEMFVVTLAVVSAIMALAFVRSIFGLQQSRDSADLVALKRANLDSADIHASANSTSRSPARRRRRWSLAELPTLKTGGFSRFSTAPFAVVMPIFSGELQKLSARKLTARPCGDDPLPVDLIFHYSGSAGELPRGLNETAEVVLNDMANRKEVEDCFHDVRAEYAEVEDSIQYPEAACVHFGRMFTKPERPLWGYSSVYQMEYDITALRAGWLTHLMPLFLMAAKGDAWVIGGSFNWDCIGHTKELPKKLFKGWRSPWSALMDGHINGNAIYTSHHDFLDIVYDELHECWNEAGFDYAMSKIAKIRNIWDKWRDDPTFLNCKPPSELRNYTFATLPLPEIAKKFPDAWLVHTDANFQ